MNHALAYRPAVRLSPRKGVRSPPGTRWVAVKHASSATSRRPSATQRSPAATGRQLMPMPLSILRPLCVGKLRAPASFVRLWPASAAATGRPVSAAARAAAFERSVVAEAACRVHRDCALDVNVASTDAVLDWVSEEKDEQDAFHPAVAVAVGRQRSLSGDEHNLASGWLRVPRPAVRRKRRQRCR